MENIFRIVNSARKQSRKKTLENFAYEKIVSKPFFPITRYLQGDAMLLKANDE